MTEFVLGEDMESVKMQRERATAKHGSCPRSEIRWKEMRPYRIHLGDGRRVWKAKQNTLCYWIWRD